MARRLTAEFTFPEHIAAELCVHYLMLAATVFESVPEEETPKYLVSLLGEACKSIGNTKFAIGPGVLWIEAITAAYEEAAKADGDG